MGAVRAKIFQNGGSQAVRLPREVSFPKGETEVLVRREGRRVILEPVDAWPEEFLSCLGALDEDIPRPQEEPIPRRGVFEDWSDEEVAKAVRRVSARGRRR